MLLDGSDLEGTVDLDLDLGAVGLADVGLVDPAAVGLPRAARCRP